jgi:drug/metabolite transporter (DMT)-like permease
MIIRQPVLLALAASACFGLALVVTQLALHHVKAADGALVSIPITTALFWILSPFHLDFGAWRAGAVAIFSLVGIFFPAAVTLLTYESNQRLGPTMTGTLGSTAPLFAAVIAVLFLGEKLTPYSIAATFVIVGGIVTLSWRAGAGSFQGPARLLLLPLAAAALRGLAQAVTKFGLAMWPSAFAASLIGYSISMVSIAADARLRRGITKPALNLKGVLWFALVGICNGAAVLLLYSALSLDAVTIVAPTVATYPLFVLVFGAMVLRGQRITARSAMGTMLTVAGVITLLLTQ